VRKIESVGGSTKTYNYVYDDRDRLKEVREVSNVTVIESYTYDPNGNRLTGFVAGSPKAIDPCTR
jgi:hypothetical protein